MLIEKEQSCVYTLLHYASSCGDEAIFILVLEQCKNLTESVYDTNNPTQETPLHFAVSRNNIEIVSHLIKTVRDIMTS